jgi:hypothetical protein
MTAAGFALAMLVLAGLGGCAGGPRPVEATPPAQTGTAFTPANDPADAAWHPVNIRFKTPTKYSAHSVDGSACIRAEANAAWSLWVATVPPANAGGSLLSWRWHVPALISDADTTVVGKDDSAVRVVIAFKGDRSKLDAAERATMSLAKAIGGNDLPYAAIQYIWEPRAPVDTILPNANTSRIKKLVVKRELDGLNSWLSFTRDVRADFRRAFPGEEPGEIESVGLMTDTDSLGGKTEACYADIVLR